MSAIRDLRRASGAMRCLECGKCSTLCPLSTLRNFSAARMAAIHDSARDLVEYAETVNRCLTCGSCEVRCPQAVHFTQFVLGLRTEMPHALRAPCPHAAVFQAAAIAGKGHARDRSWLGGDLRVAEQGEIALFVGCAPLFDILFAEELGVRSLDTTRAAIRLLNAAGIEPVLVDGERCCGHDFLWDGDVATFRELAADNAASFASRGVKHILTTCAECARTWRVDYADAVPQYRPRVEHIAEWLSRASLKFGSHEKVTFQDPCRLARHLGIVDAPRTVLSATGAELVEMPQHGLDAQCCGTSGFVRCDADSRRLQERRLDDAVETGAELLLTACPKCRIHFECAQREDTLRGRDRPHIAIEDITTFAARNLEVS
ncbi:MAG TPA: (Fe-S)-binding protein [Thermoanaerobaculia bacterium]|nr:(Fe-S)-binding protein [Thermoanaerobaculia bacterium]